MTTRPGKFYRPRKSQNTISVGVTEIFKTSNRMSELFLEFGFDGQLYLNTITTFRGKEK